MLKIAILIFAVGAVGGLILASSVLRGRMASWGLSLLHMAGAGSALIGVPCGCREKAMQNRCRRSRIVRKGERRLVAMTMRNQSPARRA